jgi:large subunit ribosomal protein L13
MNTLSYRTISANQDIIHKEWILIDAEGQVLGRLASEAAKILRGKHKTYYTPHADCGDYIIIINAEKVKLSGSKWTDKKYITHSGYPGGQKVATPRELAVKKPAAMVEEAIRGMLPRTRLGRQIFGNLHVYAGPEHPHQGQQPRELKLNTIK